MSEKRPETPPQSVSPPDETRPDWQLPPGVDEEALKRLRHDLRTPLNQIIGYTEMLLETAAEGGGSTTLTEDLQHLHSASGQILALINEGLAQWKVEAGQVDLVQLRRSLLGPLNSVLGYRDLCEETARSLEQAEVISDLEKIGFASRKLRKMLEQESFAERYHLGSPRPGAAPPPPSNAVSPVNAPSVSAITGSILVVDDEPLNREMLVRRLQRMGFTVTGAEHGLAALQLITGDKDSFDLVLLDILMPVLDGFQTLERLKADEKLKHIPVIMLTALDEVSATVRCIEAGAEDYVPKPFNPVILRARIGASLEKKHLRDQERAYLKEIQAERAKSDQLLLNVLPKAIADRLKSGEATIVDSVTDATVLFADIVGFTRIAAELSPGRTVALLNEIFSRFDRMVEEMGVEKIKTIGDAYMVVGGVPLPTEQHAANCAHMALAMLKALGEFNQKNQQNWQVRIGMHTGPLVAGIIGSKKFAYDLWGDTVNIASRLESHGEAGIIQVSEATAKLLESEFILEKRGPVELKHRGEMLAYRLIGPR